MNQAFFFLTKCYQNCMMHLNFTPTTLSSLPNVKTPTRCITDTHSRAASTNPGPEINLERPQQQANRFNAAQLHRHRYIIICVLQRRARQLEESLSLSPGRGREEAILFIPDDLCRVVSTRATHSCASVYVDSHTSWRNRPCNSYRPFVFPAISRVCARRDRVIHGYGAVDGNPR